MTKAIGRTAQALRLAASVAALACCALGAPARADESWRMSGDAGGRLVANLPAPIATVIMPEVVRLPDDTYRMYFGGRRGNDGGMDMWLAQSADATNWTVNGKVLAGTTDPCDPEFQIAGASLLALPGGGWRMYYQGRQSGPPSPANCAQIPFQIYSAVSADGVNFQREGVRIASRALDPAAPLVSAAHGRVLGLSGGGYAAYISAAAGAGSEGIYMLTSQDGLNFASPQLVAPGAHDPYVVRTAAGYLMYAAQPALAQPSPSAWLFTSGDGMSWSGPQQVRFVRDDGTPLLWSDAPGLGGSELFAYMMGDLGGVVMPDGSLRLFSNWDLTEIVFHQLAVAAPSDAVPAIEYYHAGFDHYFITSIPAEIQALDSGMFQGWLRTGGSALVRSTGVPGAANVCRFFSTAFGPRSSHFYTPVGDECAFVQGNASWQYEGVVFAMALPSATGACPAGTIPVYRLYNAGQGGAPNHRYVTSVLTRAVMILRQWIPEGRGPVGVIGCVSF